MSSSHFKSLSLALAFCLLPLGLKAQTVVNTAETSIRSLAANEVLNVEAPDGSIIVSTGVAVTGHADGNNTITNAGEISSVDDIAIVLQSLNTVTNSGTITGGSGTSSNGHGIHLAGTALAATVTSNPTAPAYDTTDTAARDAYYFNNKVTNNTGGTITGNGTGNGIRIDGARAQILNTGGTITAAGTGNSILFNTGSSQGFIQNSGNITSASGTTIAGTNEIVIHNTGTIESTTGHAIALGSLNLIVNSGDITAGSNDNGIRLLGPADATMLANNPTAPAYDTTDDAVRDAYYFNNKVVNQVVGSNTGTITGKGTGGHGIRVSGARAQILNTGGDIVAEGTGHGVYFFTGSGQGFVQNTGTIENTASTSGGNAIAAATGVNAITIHNTGTIESTTNTAIVLQSFNLVVNSNAITSGTDSHGISLIGAADATMLTNNPTAPAYDTTDTAVRDAYYFNNKVVNEVVGSNTGTITGKGTDGHGINIAGARVQILNTGDIIAEGTGHGIHFDTGSGQGFVQNTGTIENTASTSGGNAIAAATGVNAITIHNTGTIESTTNTAIVLQSFNLVVNSNAITSGTDSHGISLIGAADATMLTNNPTAPAYDTTDTAVRDAYYFNNKVVNEVVGSNTGTITGKGTDGHGINIAGARVQILNTGDIIAEGTGHGIHFDTGSGQGFVQNTGTIENTASTSGGNAIAAATGVNAITIHNTGTIESTTNTAIVLQSFNLVVNSNAITSGTNSRGIWLSGAADAIMVANNPTAPAYDSTQDLRDAYYFNNKVINETGGTITGKGVGSGIFISSARAQILNTGGDIIAEDTARGIRFFTGSGQGFVQNTGSISAATGIAIGADGGINEIVIHNTGTIESTTNTAIQLESLNLVVNSGDITAGTDSDGIRLSGTALQATLNANADRPAYDASDDDRDAYYFNNKVINQVVGSGASATTGTITGKGIAGNGINIGGARAQILNTGGDIFAEGTGHSIHFNTGSGQGFVYNTGSITAADGNAIAAVSGVDEITIHNTGTIESTAGNAIVLRSLNIVVNSGAITAGDGAHSIRLEGTADATMLTNNPTAPAHNAADATRDAYYFNNKVINETGGVITSRGTGSGIFISGARAQILNAGEIAAEGPGHGVLFSSGASQGFIRNSGRITAASSSAIEAEFNVDAITIHNTGTISSPYEAIILQSLNLIVNSGDIAGELTGILLQGAATINPTDTAQNTRPAYDAEDDVLDAYYFNNKVINEVVGTSTGTITGNGFGHGIQINGARAQIRNLGGDIEARGTGHGISFDVNSGQGFVYNTGSITSVQGNAIAAADAVAPSSRRPGLAPRGGSPAVDAITIHNTGIISSTGGTAIVLRSLNLIVNSGDITGGNDGIHLEGTALQATIDANPTAPAWDASETDRDAYYFNNTIINEVGGTITGKGTGHGISVTDKRAQIFNHGDIDATGTGHGIYFGATSGESIVVNTGNIRSTSGWGIYADDAANGIIVINGGCIEGGAGAIRLSNGDDILVVRSGSRIKGTTDFHGGTDELIYAGAASSDRPAADMLLNLETTIESDSDSDLGIIPPEPTPDPNDGSGDGSDRGGSGASPSNYATLFRLSDEIALDLNASIKDTLYEHNFGLHSEKNASENASEEPSLWARGFGSFRKQDETDDNAEADHNLGGILVGYDLPHNQYEGIGFFLGAALGSLNTDDDAELTAQNFFGGVNLDFARDNFFYGFNLAAGFTYHDSERSVKESGNTVKIKGDYTSFFLSPEFTIGLKTQMEGVNIIPSFRIRYLFASLGSHNEVGSAENRISVERRDTITMESRAQVAFPLQSFDQAWSFEPRLGLQYRADLNKDSFDAETVETKAPIDYDAEKEKVLGVFGGLSVRYLKNDTAFKFNVDAISSDESLVLRAQAGFGFRF